MDQKKQYPETEKVFTKDDQKILTEIDVSTMISSCVHHIPSSSTPYKSLTFLLNNT